MRQLLRIHDRGGPREVAPGFPGYVEFRRRASGLRRIHESMCLRVSSGMQRPGLQEDTPIDGRRREYRVLGFLDRFCVCDN